MPLPHRLRRRLLLGAALLLLPTAAPAQTRFAPNAAIDTIFAEYDSTRSPGCGLGVIRDGRYSYARGYGMANLEHGVPITPSTVFRIGSVSKQFTAAAVMLLAREGRISLDDPLRRHFPELGDWAEEVRVRQLVHHTSGLRDYLGLMWLAGRGEDDDFYTDADVEAMLARQTATNFPPGSDYLYSNSGYFLLGRLIHRVTGRTLREYAHERIFRPLGMDHTHYHDDHTEVVPHRADGYAPTSDGDFRLSMTTLDMVGDGGVFTSLEDMLFWDRNFYDDRLAGGDFADLMLRPGVLASGDTLPYAFGLVRDRYRGLERVSHGGSFVGFRAATLRFPSERLSVIALCNVATARPEELALRVADVLLAGRFPEPRPDPPRRASSDVAPTASTPAVQLDEYLGTYHSRELDAEHRIRRSDGSLAVHLGPRTVQHVEPAADNVFEGGRIRLEFRRDASGAVTGYDLDAGRVRGIHFERRP